MNTSIKKPLLPKFRPVVAWAMILILGLSTVACSPAAEQNSSGASQTQQPGVESAAPRLADGSYPVQQVTYDDGSGEYSAFLLNTPPGTSSTLRTANLPIARLTDEEISQGKQSYVKVEQGQPSLYLSEDFRIEYVHNVTENVTNPQTGQPETVVVRQESSFWTPFAGALAGQALGSLLFTPQYYMPPVYRPGTILTGYGGYGSTYDQAVSRYQSRYNSAPAEVRNRQTLRTTGRLQSPSSRTRTQQPSSTRSTGSGFGSSTLNPSNDSNSRQRNRPSFGSGSSGSGSRSFGTKRRR